MDNARKEEIRKERIGQIQHVINNTVTDLDRSELLKTALELDGGGGTAEFVVGQATKRLTDKRQVESLTDIEREHLRALAKHKKLAAEGDRSAQEHYIAARAWLKQSGVQIPGDLSEFEK